MRKVADSGLVVSRSGSGMEYGGDDFVVEFGWVVVEMSEDMTAMLDLRFLVYRTTHMVLCKGVR